MESFKVNGFHVEKIKLNVPSIQDISDALSNGLTKNFADVDVGVTDCPDLTHHPYNLLSKGLGGNPSVVQIGDQANLINMEFKNYNFGDISKALNLESSYIIGAGGGYEDENSIFKETLLQMVANVQLDKYQVTNNSKHVFSLNKTLEGLTVGLANEDEKRFSALGNLFVSQGKQGKVIRISCKKRTGKDDFASAIINALNATFSQPIALGCVFLLKKGRVKAHIAPDKPKKSMKNLEEQLKWFLFPLIEPTYLALGTILSRNPVGWHVSLQHFHGHNGKIGGHYHCDVTPEDVEYEAYVMPAEILCTIDKVEDAITLLNDI